LLEAIGRTQRSFTVVAIYLTNMVPIYTLLAMHTGTVDLCQQYPASFGVVEHQHKEELRLYIGRNGTTWVVVRGALAVMKCSHQVAVECFWHLTDLRSSREGAVPLNTANHQLCSHEQVL
jgi:hypothetical protein